MKILVLRRSAGERPPGHGRASLSEKDCRLPCL